jgi:hypothetical protein
MSPCLTRFGKLCVYLKLKSYSWVPIILATWEGEIRRMVIQGHSWQAVLEIPFPKQSQQNELQVWLKLCEWTL